MANGIVKLQAEFYSGNKEKDDFALAVEPMELLSAGPLSVNILGHLCLIATGPDFSLLVEKSEFEFKRLKSPESFRASLCQISNEGYWAFLEADKQMDKIRMLTEQIPGSLKSCLQILFKGSVDDVSDYLPIELCRIKEISVSCKTAAQQVVRQFSQVMDTMDQMLQATLVKQGKVVEAKAQAEANLKIEKEEKEFYEKQVKEDQQRSEEINKEIKERNEEYKKAYDAVPGVGMMIWLGIAETAMKVAPILALAGGGSMLLAAGTGLEVASVAGAGAASIVGAAHQKKSTNVEAPAMEQKPFMTLRASDTDLYRYANLIATQTSAGVNNILIEVRGEPMDFKLAHGEEEEGLSLDDLKKGVHTIRGKIEATKSEATNKLYAKVFNYARDMIDILCQLEAIDSKAESKANDVEKQRKRHDELSSKMKKLSIECSARTGTNTLERPGPGMMDKLMKMGEGTNLTENVLNNAHLKVECSREQLKSCEERLEKALHKSRESQVAKMKIEKSLEEYDLQTKELPQLLKVIEEGLVAMGEMKQEWSKLLRFFTSIATIIDAATGPAIKSFEDYVSKTGEKRLKRGDEFEPSDMIRQQIYGITKEAGKQAFVVNRIAGCYSTISRQHLMPLVAKLNSMIVLDKERDGTKINEHKMALREASAKARYAIDEITQENIYRARQMLQDRMTELDTLVDTCIPALPTNKMLAVQQEAKQITGGDVAPDPEIDLDDY
eukprot:GFUD01023997.1.p1 GENE.GFUD01023997.1~~GFUD01023997.1.p1  ORF type:complete len:725 (+),score=235.41 GFUD01023997.1:49-2223(+)